MQNDIQTSGLRAPAGLAGERAQELQGFEEFQSLMAQPMGSAPGDPLTSLMRTVDGARIRVDVLRNQAWPLQGRGSGKGRDLHRWAERAGVNHDSHAPRARR